jgi:limonene-1,2-epoxide hydrolase
MTPTETVNEFLARVEAFDFDGACELASADIEYENVPIGAQQGHEAMKGVLTSMVGVWDTFAVVIHRQAETGNIVMNERTDSFGRDGTMIDVRIAGVFEVNGDGKISLWRDYFDMTPFAELANEGN